MRITVDKAKLRETLVLNLETHTEKYNQAMARYTEKVREWFETSLARIVAGDWSKVQRACPYPVPEKHADDYYRVIDMLDWSLADTYDLEEHEFGQYVNDQWGWDRSFAANTGSYLVEEGAMILGFTGTSSGVTDAQREVMSARIAAASELHHGDCIEADAEAHQIALDNGLWIVIYPPVDPKARAWCKDADVVREERPYLDRNRNIVENCRTLLAVPRQTTEPSHARGEGTWYTIRYARRVGRALTIVWPDGSLSHE